MKPGKNFKIATIVVVMAALIVFRLVANKNSFDREQKLVSESSNAVPVITERVAYKSISKDFYADGTFSAEKEVTVSSEISGKVISVNAEVGNHVQAGQVLANLDHSVLSARLQQAKANLEKHEKDLLRFKNLLKTDGATSQQVEQANQEVMDARATLADLQNQYNNSFLKAPFAGTVTKRYIEKGAFLSEGAEAFDLCSISRLRLIVKVTADEVDEIKKGEKVLVTAGAFPNEPIVGTIYTINEKTDQSKQYEVEITVDNTLNGHIKPGMFGKVAFGGTDTSKALVIPRIAVAGSIKNAEVYLIKGDSVVLAKITVTSLNEKELAVSSGLDEGDLVVVSGQINLVGGTKVSVIK